MRALILAIGIGLLAGPGWAAGLAIMIGNESHADAPTARGASQIFRAEAALEAAGFEVLTGRDASGAIMREIMAEALERLDNGRTERVVVMLAGHFAQSARGSWLMGSDMDAPGLARADGDGLRLDTVLEIAALASEAGIVMIAPQGHRAALGRGLEPGVVSRLGPPRNVAVVRGAPTALAGLARDLTAPGTTLAELVDRSRALAAEGYVPALTPFLPEGFEPVLRADRAAWAEAREADTEAAYHAYLDAFPQGLSVADAEEALERLAATPERIEEALGLTRDERRAIQSDLTILGFDTRGIDGIFGPGTRNSIRGWQERHGLEQTGFLDREQIVRMGAQAARRAAMIEAEERARQAEIERQDRAFWAETGAVGDEAGLRAYLNRYPEGVFAELARERLGAIAAEAERDAWSAAQARDSIAAYEQYLEAYPDGPNVSRARDRIAALTPAPEPPVVVPDRPGSIDATRAEAEAAEVALGLPPIARLAIERRLLADGYDPGAVNGRFDADTRAAIRAWQADNGQPATGFITEAMVTQLLATTVLRLFD